MIGLLCDSKEKSQWLPSMGCEKEKALGSYQDVFSPALPSS